MRKEEFIQQLESFGLPKSEYMIRSGGSMLLRGLREETADFDLCVSEMLAQQLDLEKYPKDEVGSYIPFKDVQMKANLATFSFDVIDGYQCETLESILELKRSLMRSKDIPDVAAITSLLNEKHLYQEEFKDILRAIIKDGLLGRELSDTVIRSIKPTEIYASDDRLITDLYFTVMHFAGGEEHISTAEWLYYLQCLEGKRKYLHHTSVIFLS